MTEEAGEGLKVPEGEVLKFWKEPSSAPPRNPCPGCTVREDDAFEGGIDGGQCFRCGALYCGACAKVAGKSRALKEVLPPCVVCKVGIGESAEEDLQRLRSLIADQLRLNPRQVSAAKCNLAYMYTNVVGNPDNVEDAAKLYREASDQGSPRGQTNLGFLYEHGTGVELDYKEAARLYGLAVEKGYANAQFNLGLLYESGLGVEKSNAEALRLYTLAAEQGDAKAQSNLGALYQCGDSFESNLDQALRFYQLAVEQGFPNAQSNLGSMYATGEGVEEDPTEAVRLFRLASAQGYAEAQFSLGCMYANGQGVEQNYSTAARLFVSARDGGYNEATDALDSLYPLLFPVGVAVKVVGLEKHKHLNNQIGIIWPVESVRPGRLSVLLSGAEKAIAIRGENLITHNP